MKTLWQSLFLLAVLATATAAEEPAVSGLHWATPAIREMQEDDFANPGMFWLEQGESLFGRKSGAAGKACADCHATTDLKGVAATYPKAVDGQVRNLAMQINACRAERQKADTFKFESEPLLSLAMYLRSLSAGEPVAVSNHGAAQPVWERGKTLYFQRRGQMNLACAQCHDDRAGLWVRGEQLSQGQTNGFPAYLLRWSGVGSTHRRFRFCDDQRVAEPLPIGSEDYLALELYVAWRGNGLPVEAPAVRR